MAHDHGVRAHGTSGDNQRRLVVALVLAAGYMVAELLGGWLTGSLALLADAGHMFSDVFALTLSLVAIRIAQRPPTPQRTYGHLRSEILAALAHGALLLSVAVLICIEGVERIGAPRDVLGGPMLLVAAGGLLVNLVGLAILGGGRHESLNLRGAWLHVLSDTLGSLGALVAGALIWAFGWTWADPVASLGIAVLIVHASWALLREALGILMEEAPPHIDVSEVQHALRGVPGVAAVHDLHVWTITSGLVSLSGHLVTDAGCDSHQLLHEAADLLRKRFDIAHSTLQLEPPGFEDPGPICSE